MAGEEHGDACRRALGEDLPHVVDAARVEACERLVEDEQFRVVEQRLRAERLATDRLTRATKALVWTTGVLALATIALVVVNAYSQLSDGHGGMKRSRQPTSWTAGQAKPRRHDQR